MQPIILSNLTFEPLCLKFPDATLNFISTAFPKCRVLTKCCNPSGPNLTCSMRTVMLQFVDNLFSSFLINSVGPQIAKKLQRLRNHTMMTVTVTLKYYLRTSHDCVHDSYHDKVCTSK